MTALVVLSIVLAAVTGYSAIGLAYARSQAVVRRRIRRANNERQWSYEDSIERWTTDETRQDLVARAVFWPFFVTYDLIAPRLGGWVLAPVAERQAEAAQLRKDAEAWRATAQTGTTRGERDMARQLAKFCDARAKDLDL